MIEAINFINEFDRIEKEDSYINKKKIDAFFDKYRNVVCNADKLSNEYIRKKTLKIVNEGYKIIEKKNQKFINQKLRIYKKYFDNIFKGIDDDIILDDEQRKAILTDEDYSLVIAGAGSGKTTTMAAKVKYLVDIKKVDPQKIILLAFTNKACDELSILINEEFKLDVEVLTFHKLGMKFLKNIYKRPFEIIGSGTFNIIAKKYITEYIFKDKEKLLELTKDFDDYVTFDDKCFEYESFEEYYKYYVNKVYEANKNNLEAFITKRIRNRYINYVSITGERFKSRPEVIIANYLYRNSVEYIYEKAYPKQLNNFRLYHPDFTINNNEENIYIEYYGLLKYKEDGKYTKEEIDAYKKTIEKKRNLHKTFGTDLIELYSEYEDTNFIEQLDRKLTKRNITKIPKTNKEIFLKLMYTSTEGQYFKLINLLNTFIYKFKEQGRNLEDFEELIENSEEKERRQLTFIRDFYKYYESKIHSNYQIDFPDMINYAYKHTNYLRNHTRLTYDYIIIDEYQDISKMRYNFAKRISDLFDAKIVAVGDDWQAIYSFSGSDIELFTNFYNLMGYADIIKITNTYRNSQELLDITTNFISKDAKQFTKELKSNKHLENPIEIVYYNIDDESSKVEALINIIKKIYDNNPKDKILLLGRFNFEIENLILTSRFIKADYNKIICKDVMDANIEYLTVHKSKGTGYDQVILINAVNDKLGFPSQIVDSNIMKKLNINETYTVDYPEERRLFYVALTRTKNKVYILAPKVPITKRSEFIREIENDKNILRING